MSNLSQRITDRRQPLKGKAFTMQHTNPKVTLNWDKFGRTDSLTKKTRDFGLTEKLADSWDWEEDPE